MYTAKSINILTDEDLIKYLTKEQVFCTKEIVNIDFKTEFESRKVYVIDSVKIERQSFVNVNGIALRASSLTGNEKKAIIKSHGITCNFHSDEPDEKFYKILKQLFIPISELYESYQHNSKLCRSF